MAYLEFKDKKEVLTPQAILSRLSYFQTCAHFYHIATTNFAEHKALDELYSGVNGLKDTILETLFGYVARVTKMQIEPSMEYKGKQSSILLVKDLIEFSRKLDEYGELYEWCDLSNLAQELQGVGSQCKYLLTLE